MERERSAGAVIFRREGGNVYYLLLHYESGHWDFSKGHVENKEKAKEAALREIKEETGLEDIKFIPRFREKIRYFFRKSYRKKPKSQEQFRASAPLILKEVIFYLAETKKEDIKLSCEHLSFKWLLYKEALEKVTYKNAQEILRKVHCFLLEHENEK